VPPRPPKHRPPRARASEARPSSTRRGYGANWKRLRLLVLRRHPVCQICDRAASSCVDHWQSLASGGTNSMDNLVALCAPCHSRKTWEADGSFGRARRPAGPKPPPLE
jgi:5-methylcytosine-specific restriction protein A